MSSGPGDESDASLGGSPLSQHDAGSRDLPTHSLADQEKVADMARELLIDLRAELPRIDARAAAGAALTAAVLVSVVTQAPIPMPVYAFGVAAAVLLTLALLLFLLVLFPTLSVARHSSTLRRRG